MPDKIQKAQLIYKFQIEFLLGQRNPLTAEMSLDIWFKISLLTTVILKNISIYLPKSTFLYFLVKVLLR